MIDLSGRTKYTREQLLATGLIVWPVECIRGNSTQNMKEDTIPINQSNPSEQK